MVADTELFKMVIKGEWEHDRLWITAHTSIDTRSETLVGYIHGSLSRHADHWTAVRCLARPDESGEPRVIGSYPTIEAAIWRLLSFNEDQFLAER